MKKFDLIPQNGRKSFYGKAKVIEEGGVYVLQSYNTDICYYKDNTITYLVDRKELSHTSKTHLKSFEKLMGGVR